MKQVLQENGMMLRYLRNFSDDDEMVTIALGGTQLEALRFASQRLQIDPEVREQVLSIYPRYDIGSVSDQDVMLKVLVRK